MRKAIFGENNRKLEKSANEFMRKIQTNGTIQVKPDNLAAFVRSMMIFSMKNEFYVLKDLGKDRADHIEESKRLLKKSDETCDFNIL